MENLTHWRKTCNPNFMGSWDFTQGEGFGELVLTIDSVTEQEVFDPGSNRKEMCSVMKFRENVKPLILNVTNKKNTAKAVGSPFIEKWVGKQIRLGVEKVSFGRDRMDAVRVKPVPAVAVKCVCECCGKEIDQRVYDATKAKCGFGVCSVECRDKMEASKKE